MSSAFTTELTCKELVEVATDFFEDRLSFDERTRFELHARACTGCNVYLAQMRALVRACGRLAEEDRLPVRREQLLAVLRKVAEWVAAVPAHELLAKGAVAGRARAVTARLRPGLLDMSRFSWNALLAAALAALAATGCAPALAAEPFAQSVGCIGLTVSDTDRSAEFYARVLEFRREQEVEVAGESWERLSGVFGMRTRTVRVRLGSECLELTEFLAPRGRPFPSDARSNDRSFQHVAIVVADMDEAYRRLRAARVEHASSGPQRLPDWNPNAGGIRAFYFRDPDRHVLEVLWFPDGKGDRRWRAPRPDGALFLGIDHTAIVVGDTEESLRFWRDVLGFRVAGTSENWGAEQEHLNNVHGARLRITTLRAAGGPGVELLEYLAPRDGRPFPADERANDLFHWQTNLRVSNVETAARAAQKAGQGWISPGPVQVAERDLGFSRALLARDPDGHVVQLSAP